MGKCILVQDECSQNSEEVEWKVTGCFSPFFVVLSEGSVSLKRLSWFRTVEWQETYPSGGNVFLVIICIIDKYLLGSRRVHGVCVGGEALVR